MHVLVNALTELSRFAALSFYVGVLHEYGVLLVGSWTEHQAFHLRNLVAVIQKTSPEPVAPTAFPELRRY